MARLTFTPAKQYKPLQGWSNFSKADSESEDLLSDVSCNCKRPSRTPLSIVVLIILSIGILGALVTIIWLISFHQQQISDMAGTKKFFAAIDRSFKTHRFQHFNFSSSRYTGAPSAEVDASWASLGADNWPFFVPMSHGHGLGFERNRHAWIPKELLTFGADGQDLLEDQYLAQVETVHWLHCLNTIRKSLYYTRDYYAAREPPVEDPEKDRQIDRSHVDHCIDALRERLMCTADIEPLPWVWLGRNGGRMPDFARLHQCHDFESVRTWAEEHQVPDYVDEIDFRPSVDAVVYTKDFFT